MLFKRREKPTVMERVWISVWPRRNHARSTRYVIKRVMRIRATPHAIAAGFAAGSMASFLPYMGFHFILGFVLAWMMRGSMISAALGTAVGNPITFPMIWASSLALGRTILGQDATTGVGNFGAMLQERGFAALWEPFLLPMTLGGFIIGIVISTPIYFAIRAAVAAFQKRRAARAQAKSVANDNDEENELDLATTPLPAEKAQAQQ